MISELKPCKFCGEFPKHDTYRIAFGGLAKRCHRFVCEECGYSIPDEFSSLFGGYEEQENAIEEWNEANSDD